MSIALAIAVWCGLSFLGTVTWCVRREWRRHNSLVGERLSEAFDAIHTFDLDEEWRELDQSEEER